MENVAELFQGQQPTRYLGPALVLEIVPEGVKIRLKKGEGTQPVHAVAVAAMGLDLHVGDTVLAAGDELSGMYVMGLLQKNPTHKTPVSRIETATGACAVMDENGHTRKIQVFSNERKLLFEYDTENGKASVMMEEGDLTIRTRDGDIALDARRNIRLKGDRIEMQSRLDTEITVGDPSQSDRSRISLDPKRVGISGHHLGLAAETGDLRIAAMDIKSKKISGDVSHVRLAMKRVETIAGTMINKAKSVFQQVAEVSELKTGRLRTLIRGTWHTTSSQTVLKAKKDFKVKSDKIHLG